MASPSGRLRGMLAYLWIRCRACHCAVVEARSRLLALLLVVAVISGPALLAEPALFWLPVLAERQRWVVHGLYYALPLFLLLLPFIPVVRPLTWLPLENRLPLARWQRVLIDLLVAGFAAFPLPAMLAGLTLVSWCLGSIWVRGYLDVLVLTLLLAWWVSALGVWLLGYCQGGGRMARPVHARGVIRHWPLLWLVWVTVARRLEQGWQWGLLAVVTAPFASLVVPGVWSKALLHPLAGVLSFFVGARLDRVFAPMQSPALPLRPDALAWCWRVLWRVPFWALTVLLGWQASAVPGVRSGPLTWMCGLALLASLPAPRLWHSEPLTRALVVLMWLCVELAFISEWAV